MIKLINYRALIEDRKLYQMARFKVAAHDVDVTFNGENFAVRLDEAHEIHGMSFRNVQMFIGELIAFFKRK